MSSIITWSSYELLLFYLLLLLFYVRITVSCLNTFYLNTFWEYLEPSWTSTMELFFANIKPLTISTKKLHCGYSNEFQTRLWSLSNLKLKVFMVTQLQDALQLMMTFYGNSLFYFQAFFFKDVFHFLDFKTLNNLHKFWKNFAKFIVKDLFRSFFLNPFLGNVPLTDKLGNWFLLAKCLKNTCGDVTF